MKKFVISIVFLFTFFFMNADVSAEIQTDKKELSANDEVAIKINFDNYDFIKIKYDKNIFENLDSESFNLKDVKYDKDSKTFSLINKDKANIEVILKTKNDIKNGKTKINIDYVKDGSKQTVSETLTVKADEKVGLLAGIKTNWPYAPAILIVIAVLIILGTIYLYNKQTDEDKQKILAGIGAILAISILIFAFILLGVSTKNKEKTKNYEEYLIEVEDSNVTNELKQTARKDEISAISSDIYSRTFNIQKLNTKSTYVNPADITYTVKLNNVGTDTEIVKKDDNVIITFNVNITPYADIKAVEINGKIYSVTKVGSKYQTIVKAFDKYGDGDYTITGVVLKNGKTIKVPYQGVTVYVLKDEPSVENIQINSREEIPVLTFDVKDPDQAFVSGEVKMTGTVATIMYARAGAITILDDKNVHIGKNTYKLPGLTEGMGYNLEINLKYDLDEDKTSNENVGHINEAINTQTFEREYNFELKNPKLTPEVDDLTDLNLTFENGLFSYTDVTKVTIDGMPYEVTKENGVYKLNQALPKCQTKGKCKINIESVTITQDNGIEKTIDVNKELEYIYMKNVPTINSFKAELSNNKFTGILNFNDEDDAIVGGKLILSKNGKEKSYDLTKDDLMSSFEITTNLEEAGEYDVILKVMYDLGDGVNHTEETTGNSVIQDIVVFNLTPIKVPTEKIERGTSVDLYYSVDDNTDEDVKTITIDKVSYPAIKQNDGTYLVSSVTVPEEGEGLTRNLQASAVTYSKEISLNNPVITTINILKLKPSVNILNAGSHGGHISGEFTYNDPENAVTKAKYQINEEEVHEIEVSNGKGSFTDDAIRKAGDYNVKVTLIYDLGNGEVSSDSKMVMEDMAEVEIEAEITSVTPKQRYINKNDDVVLIYDISSNDETDLQSITINNKTYITPNLKKQTDGTYEVTISNESAKAGDTYFEATALVYRDKNFTLTKSDTNKTFVTVLKDKPIIKDFNTKYTNATLTGTLGTVTDNDNAITRATYTITKEGSKDNLCVDDCTLTSNNIKNFTKVFDKEGTYTVTLTVYYDLGYVNEKPFKEKFTSTFTVPLKASIDDANVARIADKKSPITITYKISDNTDLPVDKITVNGTDYKANPTGEADTYTVELPGQESYGDTTFTATKLIYNDKLIKEDLSKVVTVYILKDKPVINDYQINDNKFAINYIDNEDTKTNIEIDFTKNGNTTTKQYNGEPIDISDLANGKYNITIKIHYDLDGEALNEEGSIGTVTNEYENVRIITAYNANLTSLEVQSIDKSNVTLKFIGTYESELELTYVTIDGESYPVSKTDKEDEYTVTIPNPKQRKTFKITAFTFDNDVTKEVENNQTVLINKTAPTATLNAEIYNKQVKATITKTDNDNTIDNTKYFAVLKNLETEKVVSKPITIETSEVTFDEIEDAGRYQVEVVADYDLTDGQTYNDITIGTSNQVVINAEVNLSNFDLLQNNTYAGDKNFSLRFYFNSNVRLDGNVKDVTAHIEEYEAKDGVYEQVGIDSKDVKNDKVYCDASVKQDTGNYTTTCRAYYEVPKQSSVIKIKPVSFTYFTEPTKEVEIDFADSHEHLVDITKPAPKFKYKTINVVDSQNPKNNKIQVKITIDDNEKALKEFDNKSYIRASYAGKYSESIIDNLNGEQTIEFNVGDVPLNSGYRIVLEVRYDKYHGDIVNKNQDRVEDITIANYIHFITDPNLQSLNDIELVNEAGLDIVADELGESVFKQDENVKLKFDISGKTTFKPTKIKIKTSDSSNSNYPKEFNVTEADGVYTTDEYLTGLNVGAQVITIEEVSDDAHTIKPGNDNTISINVKPVDAANEQASKETNEVVSIKAKEEKVSNKIVTCIKQDDEPDKTEDEVLESEEAKEEIDTLAPESSEETENLTENTDNLELTNTNSSEDSSSYTAEESENELTENISSDTLDQTEDEITQEDIEN